MATSKIDAAIAALQKQYSDKGVVFKLGDKNALAIEAIPTGVLSIDLASGIGGLPRGRIVEIYGPEGGGKTTLALQVIAQAQSNSELVAFIDAEHALDKRYAEALGVRADDMYISQPDYGEQALEIAEALIRTGEFGVLVVDSVAALVPKGELEGQMGDSHMGLQARLMSQAMRKLVGTVSKTKTCLIFINQIREKIGVMFGNPETTTGGRALKFAASIRIEVRKLGKIKEDDVAVGYESKIVFIKNKVASPLREAAPQLIFGRGFYWLYDMINVGVEQGVIEKSGSWFSYRGERIGQGRDNAVAFLDANPDMTNKIYAEVRAKVFGEKK